MRLKLCYRCIAFTSKNMKDKLENNYYKKKTDDLIAKTIYTQQETKKLSKYMTSRGVQ